MSLRTSNGSEQVVVAGGGGFIGGYLAQSLLADGYRVRVVDIKPLDRWYQVHPEAENVVADLRLREASEAAVANVSAVYNLACNMGGMGFIESNKAECMINVLIDAHLLEAARKADDLNAFFYASTACVYPAGLQSKTEVTALREHDVYPAEPEDGYGWEKLFGERLCQNYLEDYGIPVRVARFHNVYGPKGTWDGGKEKAPAAICRKVAQAVLTGRHEIEIWGDGSQTRSFMYVDDCIYGTRRIVESGVSTPLNLGSDEMVSINQLVDTVSAIAGVELERRYDLSAPQGVRGRNSDNTLILATLGWCPSISLQNGLEKTYAWVYDQLKK